jgi:hypothetical protein
LAYKLRDVVLISETNANQRNNIRSVGFECMGLGPPEIDLYRQLKLQGALEGVTEVMELGSQDFWCPQKNLVTALCKAFGRDKVDAVLLCRSPCTWSCAVGIRSLLFGVR